ncbi:MAG: transglutaminase domain-containing protein [Cellulosilyticum sp.]|nr:transglutaminase domain-containing protein [Cellulosilyticum sp.]
MRKKLLIGIFFFIILWSNTYGGCKIQSDTANKGIIKVSCTSSSGKRLKVVIEKGSSKYTYDLPSGKMESFPLQLGNGEYKVTVLENTSGNSYQIVGSEKVKAHMSDEKSVYLASVQNIKWSNSNASVQYAIKLTSGTNDLEEKAKILYQHMANNYKYDYNKLATLPTTYLPNIDSTYNSKTGICYDFSSLYAAMLRSQGIYAKLVKGYTPNATGYHAWNEVYDSKNKKWIIIDTTYDLQVIAKNKKVSMSKSSSDYSKVYEY